MAFRIAFLFLFVSVWFTAQKREYVLIDSQNQERFVRKDSASAVKFLDSLALHHYFFTKLIKVEQTEHSTEIYFDKGHNYNQGWVRLSETISKDLKVKPEFYTKNMDSLKQAINAHYHRKGFVFNRVNSKYLGMKQAAPIVEISLQANAQRKIDGFVFRGYERLPSRFIRNLEKDFKGKIYDEKSLTSIQSQLRNNSFITLEKPPQTLFTKDSTLIYLFTQKRKSNTFDGVLGFGNNNSEKISLNGSLNLQLKNIFNGFESVQLFWQRNPDNGQTFDLQTDVPYLFKSNVGFRMTMNIYRQDSTFANVKLLPSLYYQLSSQQKIGVKGNVEIAAVLAQQYSNAREFNRKGLGLWYEYQQPTEIELFRYRTLIRTETDWLKTDYPENNTQDNMFRYFIFAERNFHLKGNHYINTKVESASLITQLNLLDNEIFRIGGWNSLRGFNENSILGNFYAYGGAEYRYLINNQAFFDFFAQTAIVQNKNLNSNTRFYSLGLGFNFFLPIGLMSFQISNGNQWDTPFNFRNTKVHWGIITRF